MSNQSIVVLDQLMLYFCSFLASFLYDIHLVTASCAVMLMLSGEVCIIDSLSSSFLMGRSCCDLRILLSFVLCLSCVFCYAVV